MKKLLVLCILTVLLFSCFIAGEEGDRGKRGKTGKTQIIEGTKDKQIKLVYEGVTITDWQDIDLTMLESLDFIEIKFFNMENELKLCPEIIKVTYQIDKGDQKTISITTWQSIIFSADNKTQLKWIGCPANKKIKIYLLY
jgi:hypothetical protein